MVREESIAIPDGPTIIATGPLTSPAFGERLNQLIGPRNLYFYDAIAPIVTRDSIDMDKAFLASRYGKGGDDYINCPMTEAEYDAFIDAVIGGGKDRAPSVREAGLLRRMHADRRDGAPRPRRPSPSAR